ncbi:major capsid protein [Capybara microvirus Cap1_SP_104]|nr:major capsid protein [Capybara microvirus Cap1_SP_104]
MNSFEKLHIKSATKGHNKFCLNVPHLTTMEIGQILPIHSLECVPSDSVNLKGSAFARMAPLVVPTYGSFFLKTASFFVPLHQVGEDLEAFHAGKTLWQGKAPVLRYFTNCDLVTLFLYGIPDRSNLLMTEVPSSDKASANWSWRIIPISGELPETHYYKFTFFGRYVYKCLTSLGYELPSVGKLKRLSASGWNILQPIGSDDFMSKKLNAEPLLCFFKAYNDWMASSQRVNTSRMSDYLRNIKYDNEVPRIGPINEYMYSNGHIFADMLYNLFEDVKLLYDNDYFTSAWQTINRPLSSSEDVSSLDIPQTATSFPISTLSTDNGSTITLRGNQLDQRSLNFLREFDSWVRRNGYSGSRDVQMLYSRFGIKPDQLKTHYAHLINTSSDLIQVGDVTSLADTSSTGGAPLGDYSGRGIANNGFGYDYKCDDFGYLITLAWIAVKADICFGYDKSVLRTSPLDFYNPEFDGLSGEPIETCEIATRPVDGEESVLADYVFGFRERYSSYKFARPRVTGDFRLFRGMDSWHFGRKFEGIINFSDCKAMSPNLLYYKNNVPSEFNRIFENSSSDADHFYVRFLSNVSAVRPMLSLSQTANLGDGNFEVSRNGNELS